MKPELNRRLEEEELAAQQRTAQELTEAEAELAAREQQRAELAARVAEQREQQKAR
jgi:hypothetical protein